MATTIRGISASLEDAHSVVDAYQQLVNDLGDRVKNVRPKVPGWLNSLAWFITLAFLWLGIAQFGLLLQGLQLLGVPLESRLSERKD